MMPRLIGVEPRGQYEIWLRFDDGTEGVLDLEAELWGEVFEPLRDPAEFRKLRLDEELGTVVWPNGADFAPEFLYHGLRPAFRLKPNPRTSAA
jgi:hypothetical protein